MEFESASKQTEKFQKAVPATFKIHCTLYNPFVLSNTVVKMASLGLHNPISSFMEASWHLNAPNENHSVT